jgi:tripartite-type tricarboxylate transporter receptor subunit TctC
MLAATGAARAQAAYPAHSITLIVPFAAGGTVDVVGNIIAQSMSKTLGQQIVLENVVGAGGTTASTRVKRAPPDGYTIMLGHMGTHGAAAAIYPNLAYDPIVDFAPIGMVTSTSVLLVVRKDAPFATLGEFIASVKRDPSAVTMAHAGMGSVSQVACQMFNRLVGVTPKMSAFQGAGPAFHALSAGRADYLCDQIVSVVPQVRAQQARALVVASDARNPALPDVPVSAEAGLPAFRIAAWLAIFAPKGTPNAVVERLNGALKIALSNPDVRKRLKDLGSDLPEPAGQTPAALQEVVRSEVTKWISVLGAPQL